MIYNYLFYRIYRLAKRCKVDGPEMTAIIAITLIEGINIASLDRIIYSLYNYKIHDFYFYLLGIIFALNCFIFYYKKKFKKIDEALRNESNKKRTLTSILVVSLAIFSQVFFIYVVESFKIK